MRTDSEMKIALVTGGATGIGAASAKALSQAGFSVGIHYNSSRGPAESLSRELSGSFLVQGDLSKSEDVDRIHDELKARGGCDVLVNNAGFNVDAPLFTAKLEDFDKITATNMRATWYLTKRISRLMMRKRSGRVINISSVIGSTGNAGQTAYAMTKAAIDSFTKSAAQELAPLGILVNSIAPGFIETKMTEVLSDEIKQEILSRVPLKRMGRPDEIAQFVRFLATEASYCTGTVLHVNGGMYGG